MSLLDWWVWLVWDAKFDYFWKSDPKLFSNGNMVFDDPKKSYYPQVDDGLKDVSNESMGFSDLREFDDFIWKY